MVEKKRAWPKNLAILAVGIWIGVGVGAAVLMLASRLGWMSFDLGALLGSRGAALMETNAPAPDFELLSTDGELVSLSGQRGKFVVLNFWASWCGPCVMEIPMFQEFHERYAPEVLILGVNQQEDAGAVRAFLQEFGVSYPILLDRNAELAPLYRLMALPVTAFIDQQGILRYHHIGAMNERQFSDYLKAMGALK